MLFKSKPISVEVSFHHVHLSWEDVQRLFGKGHELSFMSSLSQGGQFACREQLILIGPGGRLERVRVIGPPRDRTQVEITESDQHILGIQAPIRESGDIAGSAGIKIQGANEPIEIPEGVIRAFPHVHMSPSDAQDMGLSDKDKDRILVRLEPPGETIFLTGVLRIDASYELRMHIDSDEAKAFGIGSNTKVLAYVECVLGSYHFGLRRRRKS